MLAEANTAGVVYHGGPWYNSIPESYRANRAHQNHIIKYTRKKPCYNKVPTESLSNVKAIVR